MFFLDPSLFSLLFLFLNHLVNVQIKVGKHDKMGMNLVPLRDLPPEESKVFTLDLLKNMDSDDVQNEKNRGQIVVELTYKPLKEDELAGDLDDPQKVKNAPEGTPENGGLLVVIVHEAQDVEGKHHNNPYVRLLFKGEEKRTKVYDLGPIW